MFKESYLLLSNKTLVNHFCRRWISCTASLCGKRNFRKFPVPNYMRGTPLYRRQIKNTPLWDNHGMREPFVRVGRKAIFVPEMIPELIVPDLTDFKLKPYVSYRTTDIHQDEFTPKDLFDAIYSTKIVEDFKSNKLDSEGNPLEPSEEEKLTAKEAKLRAKSVGSDIFG